MGWWEGYTSFKKALDGYIWFIETEIQSWVKQWALWGAQQANNYFSILNHDWSDVRELINDKTGGFFSSISDFYGDLQDRLESSYSILDKSWYNVTSYVDNAVSGFQTSINSLTNNASDLYRYAHTTLNNKINSLSQDIDNVNDNLNIVTRTAAATVAYIGSEAEKRWGLLKKSWTDINSLVNSNINSLKNDIINPIKSDLTNLGTIVDNLINTTLKNINTTITALDIKLNKLTNDVVKPIRTELNTLIGKVNTLPTWVWLSFTTISDNILEEFIKMFNASEDKSVRFLTALGIGAGEVITTILDTPKDMVTWIKNDIADVFEDILDRVFR